MFGKRTAIILGAGASHCYEDGDRPLPLQRDIVGSLGAISVSSGHGAPLTSGPSGLMHSPALALALRRLHGLPEDVPPGADKLDFWATLRERGESLESVYNRLAASLTEDQRWLLDDFGAILRTGVKHPIPSRDASHVCRHHRRLVSALEPGDYVINFNWDSLMADALLHHCPFWYPRTGFGPIRAAALTANRPKAYAIPSFVELFHVHGSVLLFEFLQGGPQSEATGETLYLGPPGYSEGDSLIGLGGMPDEQKRIDVPDEYWAYIGRGYLHVAGRWLRPFFVPPSVEKGEYRHQYHKALRTAVHSVLPTTRRYIVIGYSFPPADFEHLATMFPAAVLARHAELVAVDPACGDQSYQDRVKAVFPQLAMYDFSARDFKAFQERFEKQPPQIFD